MRLLAFRHMILMSIANIGHGVLGVCVCVCGSLRESANGNKARQKLSDQQSEGGVHARFLHAFCPRGQTCRSTDENNEPTYLVLIRASKRDTPEEKKIQNKHQADRPGTGQHGYCAGNLGCRQDCCCSSRHGHVMIMLLHKIDSQHGPG